MYSKDSIAPLTIDTAKSNLNGRSGIFGAATFQFTEDPSRKAYNGLPSAQKDPRRDWNNRQPHNPGASTTRSRASSNAMSVQSPPSVPSTGMYVRALYDYETDDRTSLSFRQGDTIQVITQLASGWWDGVINGVRGWFPSNYCVVITGPEDSLARSEQQQLQAEAYSAESGTEDEYEDTNGHAGHDGSRQSNDVAENREQEEAVFWIPQATPDGKLYYFNTRTGRTAMELPMEAPTSAEETGPADRMNINVPDQTRAPAEIIIGGFECPESEYDETDSASEIDGDSASRGFGRRKRRSYISDGVSPAVSNESLSASPIIRNRNLTAELDGTTISMGASQQVSAMPGMGAPNTSFATNPLGQVGAAAIPRSFFDDGNTAPVTWNRLVDNMRRSIESYRRAISNSDRSEYVRKAEDISDHLRMLLVAASNTTDNHSGNPSIISTNKALYPHFRDMMSRFSKLVLSSHIAAADWPAPDSYSKCLQEAEGVLQGVYGFVEVARSQRGEDIPRLVPGFVLDSNNGGNWQNNNLATRDLVRSASFMDQEESDFYNEPAARLDSEMIDRMDEMKRIIVSGVRRLEEILIVPEKIITQIRHTQIGNGVCTAAGRVIDYYRPWLAALESIDLAPLASSYQSPQILDFNAQKQRLYDLIMHLLLSCQAVAAPLGDEWAEARGDPLENRLVEVRTVVRQLESCTSNVGSLLQLFLDNLPRKSTTQELRSAQMEDDYEQGYDQGFEDVHSPGMRQAADRQHNPDSTLAAPFTDTPDAVTNNFRKNNAKLENYFGRVPSPIQRPVKRESEETPSFLKLDYDGEIAYDTKVDPPILRGGTLTALVEQLTRHDKLDTSFNNTFLLTYKSFTTALELFELMVKRFSTQPPRGISEDDYKTWVEMKQGPIRFRVVNILKMWFDNFWMENNDYESEQLLRRVFAFAKEPIATTNTPGAKHLMAAVEQRLRRQDTNAKRMVPSTNVTIPPPIMPKNMKKLKFLDIDALEFARQLTIIESRLYGKIKPTECLNKTWQKKIGQDEPEPAANVKALILHSNQLTNWVAEMILTQSDVKKRVVVIKHFVSVADVRSRSLVARSILTGTEMPANEQLLHLDLHHLSFRDGSYTQTE